MGTSLSGQKISAKYQFLLKTAEAAFSTSLVNLEDGAGNGSDLSVATNKVKVGTSLGINQASPTYKLDISGTTSAVRVDNGSNASLLVGKGNTYGFCAGDCNPATTVGGGSGGSTAAQANKNYIAIDPTAHSSSGRVTIMNGASAGSGSIGIGQDATATGFIHIGDADKKLLIEGRNVIRAFEISGNSETLFSVDGNNKRIGLGEDVTSPANTVEIRETGTAKANTDILAITNKTNAADMDDTKGSILFNQYYYDASTPAVDTAARITAGTESDWTSTASTRDAYLAFGTSDGGADPAERMRIQSNGDIAIGTTNANGSKLYVAGDITCTGTITASKSILQRTRYKLEEYFDRKPQLAATSVIDPDANDAAALALFVKANRHFELAAGANAADAQVIYDGHTGTLRAQTAGSANDDSMIIQVHSHYTTALNPGAQSAWRGINWGTENMVTWECAIVTDSTITDCMYWAGLKLTNTHTYATDTDQAYFFYDSSKTILSNAGSTTTWHFCYSSNGTDYITNLGLVVDTSTIYTFKIDFDTERQISVYINGTQYGLTTLSGAGDTGVNVNGAVSLSSGQSHGITVDGTDATTQIVVGDILVKSDGTVLGTVTAVASATSVTITAASTQTLGDDTDIHIYGRAAATSYTKSSAIRTGQNFHPYVGILKHTNTTSRSLRIAYQKISREISTET